MYIYIYIYRCIYIYIRTYVYMYIRMCIWATEVKVGGFGQVSAACMAEWGDRGRACDPELLYIHIYIYMYIYICIW